MEPIVFFAVLVAACLHASWNALVKGAGDKHVSMTAVVLGHAPFGAAALLFVPAPAPESLPYLAAGVVFHVGYQFFLLFSYRIGDLTQVYPIARGVAPLIVTAISAIFLGVQFSSSQTIAVLSIGIGIMSLVLVRGSDGLRNPRAAMMALATGCFIAGYSLIDGTGARLAGTSLGFYAWLTVINAAVFGAIITVISPGIFARLAQGGWRLPVIGGGTSFAAYALVTWAFTLAPIALVTALRETSIVFALLIGVVFLKERLDLAKVASTAMTIFGAILLRFAR